MTEPIVSARYNGMRRRHTAVAFRLPPRPLRSWGLRRLGWPPLYAAGRLFAATADGAVLGIDAVSGNVLWRYPLRGPFTPVMSFDGSHLLYNDVLLVHDHAELIWLAAPTGQVLRRAPVSRLGLQTGAVVDGVLIAEGWDGESVVEAYELASGARRWRRAVKGRQMILASAGTAVVADDRSTMSGVDVQDGSTRWSVSVAELGRFRDELGQEQPGEIMGWPILHGDLALLAVRGYRLVALSRADGTLRWTVTLDLVSPVGTALDPDGVLFVVHEQALVAVDPATGAIRASHRFSDELFRFGLVATAPEVSTTHLFTTVGKTALAIHKERATVDWTYALKSREGAPWPFAPLLVDNRLYVVAGDGTLYVFEGAGG